MFARYAKYDTYYTRVLHLHIILLFARYAKYDTYYTLVCVDCHLGRFARYAKYDTYYTIKTKELTEYKAYAFLDCYLSCYIKKLDKIISARAIEVEGDYLDIDDTENNNDDLHIYLD